METKHCGACNTEKPTSDFYPIKGGIHSECKACSRRRYNEWRRKNHKAHAERNNKWHHANREKSLSQQMAYRVRLGDKRKLMRLGEHYKAVDRNKARAASWAKANPKKRLIQQSRREARKRSHPDTWTLAEMAAALAHWGNCCPVCGVDLNGKRHWDHWIPLVSAKCPGTVRANMIPLCGRCNTRKNDSLPDEWLKRMFPTTWEQIKKRVESYLNRKD